VKKLFALVLVASLILAPRIASSEDWASLSKAMNASCSKYTTDVKDLTMTMEMTNQSSEGTLTTFSTLFEKGGKFRAEVEMKEVPGGGEMAKAMGGMKTVVISDGKAVWMVNPMAGKVQLPLAEGEQYRGQWHCKDYIPQNAEIAGSETVSGHDCYILNVKDENADAAKLWIDKKTYQLLKIESKPQDGETTVAVFSDFRKAGDWEFPYKTDILVNGEKVSTVTVKSVEVNKGLGDELFDADKVGGKPSGMMDMIKKMKEQSDKENIK
jgi:outer membrane lipoprotein-sorting protein